MEVLPGRIMLGPGAVSMISLSPSNLKWRRCSVPFHDSFQETSTEMIKSLPSIRYLPLTATIDLCSVALSASPIPPLRFSAVKSAMTRLTRDGQITLGVRSKDLFWRFAFDNYLL